jgi:uncharacterized membrane protein
MKNQRMILLTVLSAVSFVGISVAFFFLPVSIPIHWGVNGQIDRWGHRANILWMGGLPLAMVLLSRFLPKIDPRSEAYERHKKAYAVIITSITVFFIAIGWLTVAVSLGVPIDMSDWIRGGIGLLFIGMGNFMSQLKRNFFIGIKTPWALADDEVWRRTHRRGAWVFVIAGLAFLVSVAIPDGPILYGLFIALGVGIVYIYVYSYMVHRSLRDARLKAGENGGNGDDVAGDPAKGGQA